MSKTNPEDGKTSGCVYNSDPKLTSLLVRSMEKFAWSNPLHTSAFLGVRKMEAEVIQMVVDLFNGTDAGACGALTSGGTESILMAIRAYREWARNEKSITEPHMVVPITAHAAFDKGAEYFGVRITHVPVNPSTKRVDVAQMRNAICPNTIMIVGSCPQYPHGIIDDIEALGKIAQEYRVALHVDCCLGSFIVPFLESMGIPIRPFDFRVPGVTSISCDTHKYGFAPKGSSVIMYRTKELRRYQYFCQPDWPGGVYASPTMAGSRPGSLVVGCWAAMVYFGRTGYFNSAKEIVAKTKKMIAAVQQHPELFIFGDPQGSVFAFGSNHVNVYQLGGYLHKNSGWDLSYIQFPAGIHISTTLITNADVFGDDLKKAMSEIRANPAAPANSEAKFYGTASSVPDRSIIDRVARGFVDATYLMM
jgi:sphinganine-1-phosphate aldolase